MVYVFSNNVYEMMAKRNETRAVLKGINSELNIRSIKEHKIGNKEFLMFDCSFLTAYLGDKKEVIAQVVVSEKIILGMEPKEKESIMKNWEKNKKLPKRLEDKVVYIIKVVGMYDIHLVTNKFSLPPPIKYDFS